MSKQGLMVLALAAVFSLGGACGAFATEGGEGHAGNGGGGVLQDGRYMTFYSAGLYTEPDPKTPTEIPGLDWTVTQVNSMSFLSPVQKTLLVNALLPSPQHEYYKAKEGEIDSQTIARLKAEFSRVTGADTSRIVLYALTDTSQQRTFLLPDFYKLTDSKDQAAILFHESYWLAHPKATYSEVVGAEMAFQAVLVSPNDPNRVLDFMKRFASVPELFRYASSADQASGALTGLVDAQFRVDLRQLVGDPFAQCIREDDPDCSAYLNLQLGTLVARYPKSVFLGLLREQAIPANPASPVGIWYYTYEWNQIMSNSYPSSMPMSDWNLLLQGKTSDSFAYRPLTSPLLLSLTPVPDSALGQDYSFAVNYDFDSSPYIQNRRTVIDHEHGSFKIKFWAPPAPRN